VASKPVVIGRRAVELVIRGVLQQETYVLDRQIVELDDVARAVRLARVAVGIRAVQAGVRAARRGVRRQRAAVLPLVVGGPFHLERAQRAGRVRRRGTRAYACARRGGDGKARVVRLLLVDVGRLRGEDVRIGDVLVLRIDGEIAVPVGRRRRVEVA